MVDPQVQQILDSYGLTEDDLEALYEAGVFNERSRSNEAGLAISEQARSAPMQGGQMVSGYYVPPSFLSQAAGVARNVLGAKGTASTLEKQKTLIDLLRRGRKTGGMAAMLDRLGGVGGTPYQYEDWMFPSDEDENEDEDEGVPYPY